MSMPVRNVRAGGFGAVRTEDSATLIGDEPVQVPDTYYYRHLLSDGSLTEVDLESNAPQVADANETLYSGSEDEHAG